MDIKKRQLNVSIISSLYTSFQKMYPQCLSRFVRNAIRMALSDKMFFQKVFFSEVN